MARSRTAAKAAKAAEAETKTEAEKPAHVQQLEFTQVIVQNGMKLINSLKAPREAALARTKLDEFALWAQVAIAASLVQDKTPAEGQ